MASFTRTYSPLQIQSGSSVCGRSVRSLRSAVATRRQRRGVGHAAGRGCAAMAAGGKVEKPDVRKLADLARLKVSDEEVERWTPMLGSIADWFDQLGAVDVTGVEPALRATSNTNNFREDVPSDFADKAEMLGLTEMSERFVKVPKVMGESEG